MPTSAGITFLFVILRYGGANSRKLAGQFQGFARLFLDWMEQRRRSVWVKQDVSFYGGGFSSAFVLIKLRKYSMHQGLQ